LFLFARNSDTVTSVNTLASVEQHYYTKIEAAQYLRRSPRTIDSLLARGELKAYRPGARKLLFAREELDAYVKRYPVVSEREAN
jgi:excisionase family DNA binding protein